MRSSLIDLTAALLVLALSGCAGNQAAENALKPDSRLTTQPSPQDSTKPEAKPQTPIARSSEPQPSQSAKPSPIASPPTDWQDRDRLPTQIKPYVEELLALNLLSPDPKILDSKPSDFAKLNTPITRREFAKWLLVINNRFYQSRPTKQVRVVGVGQAAVSAEAAAFSDIPSSDPDYTILQSLAEAGILPSRLSGEDKSETFRPSDALTRENLLRWKVPLDIRSPQTTPGTPMTSGRSETIETLQKNIPFQDLNKLNHPDSLRAVALDFQNGDQSNLRRSFGYTKLLQPQRTVTRAEAAAALWSIGTLPEVFTAKDALTGKAPDSSQR
jgi:hypothetical protein